MSPIKRGGIYYLYVPRPVGRPLLRTTETGDNLVRRGMKRMLRELKDTRRWKLLNAVTSKPARLTLGQLYDAYTANTLDALEATLSASNMTAHVEGYLESLRAIDRDPRYLDGVKQRLEAFIAFAPSGTTADLTTAIVKRWMAGLRNEKGERHSSGTRRQYLYAVTGFAAYLSEAEILPMYPLGKIKAPKKNKARTRWETQANDQRLVDAADPKYRALFAFLKSTGADVSTAFRTYRRDIDLDRGVAHLMGTKTDDREVHEAIIEAWALPYLREYLGAVTPNALPWPPGSGKPGKHGRKHTPFFSVAGAGKEHDECCAACQIEGYTLKDARHSVAVRMRFAGYELEEIAEQLGNSVSQVARIYARFKPKMTRRVTDGVTRPLEARDG